MEIFSGIFISECSHSFRNSDLIFIKCQDAILSLNTWTLIPTDAQPAASASKHVQTMS